MIFQVATLPLIPESPKYNLIVKNRAEQAEEDLKKLRGKDNVIFFLVFRMIVILLAKKSFCLEYVEKL